MCGVNMLMNDTPEGFIRDFSFVDEKQVYTNGSELIAVFRVKQMMEHYFREVEPVVHARWEFKGLGQIAPSCSRCGIQSLMRYPRCPHCGAKMDGRYPNENSRNPPL